MSQGRTATKQDHSERLVMSADAAGSWKANVVSQRGERPWRDKPTPARRVLTQNPRITLRARLVGTFLCETVRAIRYCLPEWNTAPETKALREHGSEAGKGQASGQSAKGSRHAA